MHIAGSGGDGGSGPGGVVMCDYCGESFSTQSQRSEHNSRLRYGCSQHGMCFESWRTHVDEYSHTYCPVPGCAKAGVDFGGNVRFEQHFRNKH